MVLITLMSASLLVGCSADEPAPAPTESMTFDERVSAAQQEGTLTLYSTASDGANQSLAQGFEEEYGIKVEVLRLVTTDLVARFASEAASGVNTADAVLIGVTNLFDTSPQLFREYGDMPNAVRLPDEARESDITVVAAMDEQTVVWNTDLIKEGDEPQKWEDILDSKWKGNCILLDPRTTPTYLYWAKVMRDKYGDDFLRDLAAQDCRLADSGVTGSQQVAAGAAAIVVPPVPNHAAPLIRDGAPLAIQTMPEFNVGSQQRIALPAISPHANAGWLFMDWVLGTQGQEIYCAGTYASLDPEAKDCWQLPADYIPARSDLSEDEANEIFALLGLQ